MNVGSLFAGIGGFDLGFERAGMQTAWQVELDPYCQAVLAQHFPDAKRFDDVCAVGAHNLEPVDLICGGFPCQDISLAGKGAGIDGARSGLWSEFARIIGELGPRYAVVENVPALRSRGLDRVLRDLAALGYDAEWDCIPASAVGAPHQRDRFWLVAYPNEDGARLIADRALRDGWEVRAALGGVTAAAHSDADRGRLEERSEPHCRTIRPGERASPGDDADRLRDALADPERLRRPGGPEREGSGGSGDRRGSDEPADADPAERCEGGSESADGRRSGGAGTLADPAVIPERESPDQTDAQPGSGDAREVPGGGGGGEFGEWWRVEPDVGRVAHGVPARVDRLSALGNALVPQIAEWIGRRIVEYEEGGVA